MTNPLWQPSPDQIKNANLTRFMQQVEKPDYAALYDWSVTKPADFWNAVWDFCAIIGEKGDEILCNGNQMQESQFFPQARLNFAENLLRRNDDAPAIMFWAENQKYETLTFAQLHQQVSQWQQAMQSAGVGVGDRVAAYMPNCPQTVIAMLAASSIGAIFSSCSPDFGVEGVVDRFGQIDPKIFITVDGYFYKGKKINITDKVKNITIQLPTVQHVWTIPFLAQGDLQEVQKFSAQPVTFEQLPFDHPLYIMYSSGTTGAPKSMVHGAGGTLIQHLKEHQLHSDIKKDDRVFYFTTCGWMMWNWLVSALASNASLVLYDGNPFHPKSDILFDLVDATATTFFGTSAKYIEELNKQNVKPVDDHHLHHLRVMASTGSPLSPQSFDYVYTNIKKNICLSSIAGGTDIISCFVLGNPIAPVYRGEIQTRGLGMKVDVFDDNAKSLRGEKGELVCTAPFPSMPIKFWNDPDGSKYQSAYFDRYQNIWHHGDYMEITPNDGVIIYGRSDATLNPGGVRIGTAEIYRQLEHIPEIIDAVVVGQEWENDVRVLLFVCLRENTQLNDDLITRIKNQIKNHASPRHVPAKILSVPEIPRTKSGKITEIAVRDVIHGRVIKNKNALSNPLALDHFKNRPELNT